jgi:PadR family transcriptional regulator, regulatory protein PadR
LRLSLFCAKQRKNTSLFLKSAGSDGKGVLREADLWQEDCLAGAIDALAPERRDVVDGCEVGGRDDLDVTAWTPQPFLELKLPIVRYLLFSQRKCGILCFGNQQDGAMKAKKDVQQGTLALMVLKTLDVLGPLHGYGIAGRIEQISEELLAVNQGTLYPVLLRLEQDGAVASELGASENNRRARFYRLTREGRKQLQAESKDWLQTTQIIGRFFALKAEDVR